MWVQDGNLVLGLLTALCVLPAVLIGSVHPGSQILVLALAALSCVLVLVYRGRRPQGGLVQQPRLLLIIMAIGLGLTLVQMLPLPPALLRLLSPAAMELRTLADDPSGKWVPISLSPWSTVLEWTKQLSYLALFLAAANFLHRGNRARRLCMGFFWGGVGVAMLGLLQRALHFKRILGIYEPDWWYGFMATFVDSNHAAGFFVLVIGVGVGLALADAGRARIAVLIGMAPLTLAIVLTGSRGGLAGLGALVIVLAALRFRKMQARRDILMVSTGLLMISAIGMAVAGGAMESRIMALLDNPLSSNAKIQSWGDATAMSTRFAWTGVGRGAFGEVFPSFKKSNFDVTVTHPENLVLQLITEWGYPGALVVILLGLVALVALGRASSRDPLNSGIFAGLAALLFQNLFDFNLEFPGTAAPAAILLGLLVARTMKSRARVEHPSLLSPLLIRVTAVACVGTFFLALPAAGYWLHNEDKRLRELTQSKPMNKAIAKNVEASVGRHPADYHTHLLAGVSYLRSGDSHGLRHLNAAMFLNPRDGLAHIEAARALASAGYIDQAAVEYRTSFERGIQLSDPMLEEVIARCGGAFRAERAMPQHAEWQLAYATYLERHGHVEAARAVYRKLAATRTINDPGLLEALRALLRLGDPDPARLAQRLGQVTPVAGDIALAARVLAQAGQTELADQLYLDARVRFAGDWAVIAPTIDILTKRGDLLAAERSLQDLLERGVSRAERALVLEKLATVQEALGQRDNAEQSRTVATRLRAMGGAR